MPRGSRPSASRNLPTNAAPPSGGAGLRREDEVDGGARQEGTGELRDRLEEEDDEGAARVALVGEGEREEAAEEAPVETASLGLVLGQVLGHGYAASTSSERRWRSASSA